jgi:hypothetical protein
MITVMNQMNMKKLFIVVLISTLWTQVQAQESMEKTMEKRAREMHRVLGLNDPAEWKKFIVGNYTKALIEKPMRATVKEEGGNAAPAPADKPADPLEAKVKMYERLHHDFGGAKIVSIKPNGELLRMTLDNGDGMIGTFQLKFEKNSPWLIDGIGIQAEN